MKKYNEIFVENGGASNLQNVLRKLKEEGASQMECVRTLVMQLKISIREADEIVLNSEAWCNEREETELFRDQIDKAIGNLNDLNF